MRYGAGRGLGWRCLQPRTIHTEQRRKHHPNNVNGENMSIIHTNQRKIQCEHCGQMTPVYRYRLDDTQKSIIKNMAAHGAKVSWLHEQFPSVEYTTLWRLVKRTPPKP
jgi:hypothetical protein